ncbi:MAG: quinone-dependent dihydroorotate dehydrogenase [Ignavibacteria bacterium]
MFYKIFIRPVLFLFDPEDAHNFILNIVSQHTFLYSILKLLYSPAKTFEQNIYGVKFKNQIGLAAGFDKNGVALKSWESLGFSHVEVGTVTPLPQSGNVKPRIFRLKKDWALINRLGFNNKGAVEINNNILLAKKDLDKNFIVGVNIGKNKNTSIKDAVNDYKICFEKLYDAADYFTLNISSPNTEGLRKLHEEEYLDKLLSELQILNNDISKLKSRNNKCIFLKIAPDLNYEMIELVYNLSVKNKINGIIATNTTVERNNLTSKITEQGGLSGKPLKKMSDKVLKKLCEMNKKNPGNPLILIGVGGVFSKKDFDEKINFGASLVQLYTGFIYEGPSIIKKLISR